jgi:type IV secretory pathway TrbL component
MPTFIIVLLMFYDFHFLSCKAVGYTKGMEKKKITLELVILYILAAVALVAFIIVATWIARSLLPGWDWSKVLF